MSKQLGDKAIKFIIDLVTDGDSEIEIFEAKQELDQLIEKANRVDELENIIFGKFKKGECDNQLLNIVVKNVHKHVEYIELGEAFKWAEENKFRFRYGNDYWDVGGILQAYRNEVSNV